MSYKLIMENTKEFRNKVHALYFHILITNLNNNNFKNIDIENIKNIVRRQIEEEQKIKNL